MFVRRTLLYTVVIGAAVLAFLVPPSAAVANPSAADIQAQIDKGNNDVELVVEAYNKVNGDLATTQTALTGLETRMKPLQSNVDAAHANVNQIARTAYETGTGLRTMSLLLSINSSGALVDQLATLQQLSRNQQHEITTFNDAKKSYDAEKKRLNDLLAAQNAQKADLQAKKTKIEAEIARLDALQKTVNASAPSPPAAASTSSAIAPVPKVSGAAGKVVAYAVAQLNKRYVWGTAGPDTFDCSGLTMMAWNAAGVSLPHNAAEQYNVVRHITRSELVAGDLVFYNGLGHVGIYIGNDQIIHAPNSRTVVKIAPITVDPLYGYGRP